MNWDFTKGNERCQSQSQAAVRRLHCLGSKSEDLDQWSLDHRPLHLGVLCATLCESPWLNNTFIKKTATLLLLYCFAHCSFGQIASGESSFADSLLHLAETAESDSLRMGGYLHLSNYWSDRDTASAFAYLRQAKLLMPPDGDFYQGLAHYYAAGIYFDRAVERSQKEYLEAEKYLKRLKTKEAIGYRAKLWNNYGVLLQMQDRQGEYMDILIHQAIPLAKEAGDSILVANNYQNVALVLMNVTDYAQADEYYSKAIQSLSSYPKANEEKLTAFVNAAKNAIYSRDFPKAKEYLDNAKLQLDIIPHSLYAPVYHGARGTYHRHQKNKDAALESFQTGLELARRYADRRSVSSILYEKYLLFKAMEDYQSAKTVLLEAYATIPSSAHDRRLHLKELATTDANLGQYRSAYDWLSQYTALSDSLFEQNAELAILELEKKFESVESENEILKLKDQNQQQQLRLEENKLLVVVLIAVLLIGALLLFFGWRLYKSKKRDVEQNALLHRQEVKSLQQREKLKVYNAMLQGQEQERNRIARDLHDGLGGMLAGVKLKLSSIASKENKHVTQPDMELYKVIHQLDQSVDELRRIARNMMPESLIYMGLEPALRDLCNSLHSEKTAVVFEAFDLGSMYEQALQISVYRIVQELLTNSLKHAEASTIMVQCSENENRLYITVEDDGKGFSPESVGQKNGVGLSNIRNRVSLLQGTVKIDSTEGEGTTFHIEIPLNEK